MIETLQPEAGDDRNKEAEIARLEEMYNTPRVLDTRVGLGDVAMRPVSRYGHLVLRRSHLVSQHSRN